MIKYILILLGSVVLASLAQMLLKKATFINYENKIREYLNVYVISGYGLMFISSLLSVLAFKGLDYKFASVIDSFGYILVLVLSYLFFKEKLTKNKIIGSSIILIGIIIFFI